METAILATCSLNQHALDFSGNYARVRASCAQAKAAGARYRLGPELELCGYGCEDHFYEADTVAHSWETLARLLSDGSTDGLLCDFGMPLLHRGVRYNCRVWCLGGAILLIRPKLALADDGCYREGRWFTAWPFDWRAPRPLEECTLPPCIASLPRGQRAAPFGVALLAAADAVLASESCEELFTPGAPHAPLSLAGADIVANGSGSHHQLRKLHVRVDLMRGATARDGGAYLYANQQGCDGGRLYFDGSALVFVNGECVAQGSQFSLADVEVVTAAVNLADVRSARAAIMSRGAQAAAAPPLPRIAVPLHLCAAAGAGASAAAAAARAEDAAAAAAAGGISLARNSSGANLLGAAGTPGRLATAASVASASSGGFAAADEPPPPALLRGGPSPSRPVVYLSPEEEIALGPACYLWDFLRRSGACGFFLPLSGGADSAATASIVGVMAQLVHAAVAAGNGAVLRDLRAVLREGDEGWAPASAGEVARRLLHTCYMATELSSAETRARARAVAADVGAYHLEAGIDAAVAAVVAVFAALAGGFAPRFRARGGAAAEDLALQNVQARLRMVVSYLLAQLLPTLRARERSAGGGAAGAGGGGGGFLLVLGSSNVDEALRGYLTKYDCSSADINPIGGIAKGDLKRFLLHAAERYSWPSLRGVVAAGPTAELQPSTVDPATGALLAQLDEVDMGMTYEELGRYGRLRKIERCGPVTMYHKLRAAWPALPPAEVARKCKHFFVSYAVNRHKSTTLTPAYHAENYSPEDNRFDLRPFLYNTKWTWQFRVIDEHVMVEEEALAKEQLQQARLQAEQQARAASEMEEAMR